MKKIYAVINDGVVVNMVISETALLENWVEVCSLTQAEEDMDGIYPAIGWTYNGETFTKPEVSND